VIGGGKNSDRDGQESDVEKSGAVLDTVERSSERIAELRDPDGPICKKDRRECRDRWRLAIPWRTDPLNVIILPS